MNKQLDEILQLAPDDKNIVEQAVEIIQAEVISEPLVPTTPYAPSVLPTDPHAIDLDDDVAFARQQIKDLIDDGRSAMNGALELAASGDTPRAYEVVAVLLTAVVQANKELIILHKTRKETLKAERDAKNVGQGGPTPVNIDKAVFIGRASDLLRELQNVKKQTAAALTAKSSASEP